MKIGHPANKPPVTSAAGTPGAATADVAKATPANKQPTAANATAATVADPSSTVALSSAASTLLAGSISPDFDAGKVAQISSAIDNGSYKVNHAAIADKLIANAQELLVKVKS